MSRGLWQHSGSILLLSLTLYGFLTERKQWMILSAIPLFFSYVVRPTNLLPIFFFSLIAIYRLKLKSVFFLGQGILVLSIFFYMNFSLFGSMVHPYYDFRKVSGSDTFYEALVANLFSPFFVYYLIFSVQYIDKRTILYGFFLLTLLISFYINFKGAQYMQTYLWNLVPDNIDTNSGRNWNWKDLPFLR